MIARMSPAPFRDFVMPTPLCVRSCHHEPRRTLSETHVDDRLEHACEQRAILVSLGQNAKQGFVRLQWWQDLLQYLLTRPVAPWSRVFSNCKLTVSIISTTSLKLGARSCHEAASLLGTLSLDWDHARLSSTAAGRKVNSLCSLYL